MRRSGTSKKPSRPVPRSTAPPPPDRPRGQYSLTPTLVGIALVVATLAAYGNLYGKGVEFFRLDDGDYVINNPIVNRGMTAETVGWAFTQYHAANWHPLTWMSLQIDYELYGLEAGGYHVTNALLHAAASVLLLVVLERMTRLFWASALVAALFALHPLRVESVAWISERKDVLGAFFWILTMGVYAWYARRPGPRRYALVAVSFALGLLAKPMLVTLPCALLLLDYWPLRRFGNADTTGAAGPPFARSSLGRLIVEKLPLLALSAVACIITLDAQTKDATLMENLPPHLRVLNAALAYVEYLGQTFWPVNLAPLYSRPTGQFPMTAAIVALAAILVVTGLAFVLARRRPYVLVGWLWFLGTLVPVIGLVQVGVQTMADRYTYIPHIGLLVTIVWGLWDLLGRRVPGQVLFAGAGAMVLACFILTYAQAFLWQDNVLLWQHTLKVTKDNYAAHDNLGVALMGKGRAPQAMEQFHTAMALEPKYVPAYMHLGQAFEQQEQWAEAAEFYRQVIARAPEYAEAYTRLATCALRQGQMAQAIEALQSSVHYNPGSAENHFNLGTVLLTVSRYAEAEPALKEALRLDPSLRDVHPYLGWAYAAQGKQAAAREQYALGSRYKRNWQIAMRRQAWRLATDPDPKRRNGPQALLWARMAASFEETDPEALDTLAAALADNGQYPEAAATLRKAIPLAAARKELDAALRDRLRLYESGQPYREAEKRTK